MFSIPWFIGFFYFLFIVLFSSSSFLNSSASFVLFYLSLFPLPLLLSSVLPLSSLPLSHFFFSLLLPFPLFIITFLLSSLCFALLLFSSLLSFYPPSSLPLFFSCVFSGATVDEIEVPNESAFHASFFSRLLSSIYSFSPFFLHVFSYLPHFLCPSLPAVLLSSSPSSFFSSFLLSTSHERR